MSVEFGIDRTPTRTDLANPWLRLLVENALLVADGEHNVNATPQTKHLLERKQAQLDYLLDEVFDSKAWTPQRRDLET